MMPQTEIDLVITTCEGREQLLAATLRSLSHATAFPFARRILAADGPIRPGIIDLVKPDLVVQSSQRRGYISSIQNVLRQVRGEYFFWLEDDWSFTRRLDVPALAATLSRYEDAAQIRLSKTAPLVDEERAHAVEPGVFASTCGFSANPSLNRTAVVHAAFEALNDMPRRNREGFEIQVSEWLTANAHRTLVADPGDTPPVTHEGYLESTPREWHMTAFLDTAPEFVFSLGERPAFWRRIWMAQKLARRCAGVAARQLTDDSAYELAFRMVTAPLPRRRVER